jgi:hypothetical protein
MRFVVRRTLSAETFLQQLSGLPKRWSGLAKTALSMHRLKTTFQKCWDGFRHFRHERCGCRSFPCVKQHLLVLLLHRYCFTMSVLSGVSSCISLSVRIVDLLLTSKDNKHEFRSLKSAVDNIRVFLTALPQEGITQQGSEVLSEFTHQQQRMPIDKKPSGAFSGCRSHSMHGAVGQPHPGTSTITNQGQPQH